MRIENPATGELLREIDEDTDQNIAEKTRRARNAQREWARTPYETRAAAIRRFGEIVAERRDSLAKTLTLEVGKPISQSHNELKALGARIEFFLTHSAA